MTPYKKAFLTSLFAALVVVIVAVPVVYAGEAKVSALGKITVEEAEELTFKQTLTKLGGRVISRAVGVGIVALEIFWPDSTSNAIFLEMCVNIDGKKSCTDPVSDSQQIVDVGTTEPGSYNITWNVLENTPQTKCYAFDVPMSIDTGGYYGVNFFNGLPYVGPVSYVPNVPWEGSRPVAGEAPFTGRPSGAYYYNLVCYNPKIGNWLTTAIDQITLFGTVSQQAFYTKQQTIVVGVSKKGGVPLPVSVDIKANDSDGPVTISGGDSVTVRWRAENTSGATPCTGSRGAKYPASGSFVDTPSATRDYGMTCTGSGGEDTDTVTVNVLARPEVDLKVNSSDGPITVSEGDSITISWSTRNVDAGNSCTATGAWSGSKAGSGSESTGAITFSRTYTLTCSGFGLNVSDSVSVNVRFRAGAPFVDIKAE